MDLKNRADEGVRKARESRAGKAAGPLLTGLAEVLAIAREMLAIPLAMILGLAERLGDVVLAVWRQLVRPLLVALLGLIRRALNVAEREVTPSRAVAAVAIAAAVLLAISQFAEYREVRAGVPAYAEVESVAPPPTVSGSVEVEGAEARLLGAFWVQLLAGAVIAICGPLLAATLRPESARARSTHASRRPERRRPRLGGPVEEARP